MISRSASIVSFDAVERLSLALSVNAEFARGQAELSYAHDCCRCCFCVSQIMRERIGEEGRSDISSPPHHRFRIGARTEGRGPGVFGVGCEVNWACTGTSTSV